MTSLVSLAVSVAVAIAAGPGADGRPRAHALAGERPPGGSSHAVALADPVSELRGLLSRHRFSEAGALAAGTLSSHPGDPVLNELLGDAQHGQGRDREAVGSYERAIAAGGESAELAKKVASSSRRLMRWSAAGGAYREALRIAPEDPEAREDYADLRRSRGVRLRLWTGGWELDRSRSGFGALASYGGLDRTEVYAGYARSDQDYYVSSRWYGQAYYHPAQEDYVKLEGSWKSYRYPGATTGPAPDATAYSTVPSGEVEVRHRLHERVSVTTAYQLFAPLLFHDPGVRAVNHKASVGTELRVLPQLRLTGEFALLRDPDPDRTAIRGRIGPATAGAPASETALVYRTSFLLGAGVGWAAGRWALETRYVPNRDLDGSYSTSLISAVSLEATRRVTVKVQHVLDRYADASRFAHRTANVALAGAEVRTSSALAVDAGVKVFGGPLGGGVGGYVALSFRTGVGP